MQWTERASTVELSAALAPYFPSASPRALSVGIERYRKLQLWKTTPAIAPSAIERFQDILLQSQVLPADRRVKYDAVVASQFAERAS
jgi:NitT/TauT family transport system substrate-binding protein